MASCPSCQSQIEIGSEYFGGLFTCPQCRAVYFIGFDGVPEKSDAPPPQVEYTPPAPQPEYQQEEYQAMDLNEPSSLQYEPEPSVSAPPAFSPLQDVVDFANDSTTTGISSFNLLISGLESNEAMQALKDVLTDSKLGIDFNKIRSQIKNGRLQLTALNPAQAAVIAFRLRPLPLEMKWEQTIL